MKLLPLVLFFLTLTALALPVGKGHAAGVIVEDLTPAEKAVIREKATERPFSGQYWDHKAEGLYLCRQCGLPLYISKDKFDSRCGWPSFDDAVPGAVHRQPDADGQRVEITCASCGGHLGHVFEGEGFTAKNTRHCVNSLSLRFVSGEAALRLLPVSGRAPEIAYFAGGCFWGTEDGFAKVHGVLDVVSGYCGGSTPNPSYQDVCSGRTGHAETVRVIFDPGMISYEELVKLFFEIHDPTQRDRQGPDVGTQYRSAIFTVSQAQQKTALALADWLEKNRQLDVATIIEPFAVFYPAEGYHQDYAERTGRGACHFRVKRF